MLLPPTCPVCDRPGPAPCLACCTRLHAAPDLGPPAGADSCRALLAYQGAGRALVGALKYRNARSVVPWLVAGLELLAEELLRPAGGAPAGAVGVTWVPATPSRRRRRGFDQSRVLAQRLAARLGLTCGATLHRFAGPPQTGLVLADRRPGPPLVAAGPAPARVVLVDDVVTSGATVSAACRCLRAAGARRIDVLAVARTPREPGGFAGTGPQ